MKKAEAVARPRIHSVMVGFTVSDMSSAVEFYTGKLGFKVRFKNGAVFTIVSRDGIEISLALERSGQTTGNGACYLKVGGVDAIHDEFLAKGAVMTHPLRTESYGMREFMITDPDGNTLNFGEPVEGQGRAGG